VLALMALPSAPLAGAVRAMTGGSLTGLTVTATVAVAQSVPSSQTW